VYDDPAAAAQPAPSGERVAREDKP
jgi:hypothetical protein